MLSKKVQRMEPRSITKMMMMMMRVLLAFEQQRIASHDRGVSTVKRFDPH